MHEIWSRDVHASDPIDVLNIKLKRIKIYFKDCGSDKYMHAKKRKQDLRMELYLLEELEEDGPLTPELYSRKVDTNFELHELLINEEIYWLQQSHERWLLNGDRNTDYFHKIANGCKRKNVIHALKCADMEIEGTENLIAHATDFYKELSGPAPKNQFHLNPNTWSNEEKLNDDDNADLTRQISEEEVKASLFAMDANMVPGLDNVPVEFYQCYWETVKGDIM